MGSSVAKPINKQQTVAALSGVVPENARGLQERWNSVIDLRALLLLTALLCQVFLAFSL
jgi:hypothetical protein